jgi:hypothetical protein
LFGGHFRFTGSRRNLLEKPGQPHAAVLFLIELFVGRAAKMLLSGQPHPEGSFLATVPATHIQDYRHDEAKSVE